VPALVQANCFDAVAFPGWMRAGAPTLGAAWSAHTQAACGNMAKSRQSVRDRFEKMLSRFQKHYRWIIWIMVIFFVGSMFISATMMFR